MTTLPFPSIVFPGRTSLAAYEVAKSLRVTQRHVINLAGRGDLGSLRPPSSSRGTRILREDYDQFVLRNLTVPSVRLPPEALDPRRFPFPISDLTGHRVFLVEEVASVLRVTPKHVGDLIAEGALPAVNVGSAEGSRYCFRIPGEAYRAFIVSRIVASHPRNRLKTALSRTKEPPTPYPPV